MITRVAHNSIEPVGRYVSRPAHADAEGVKDVPPPVLDPLPKVIAGAAVGAAIASLARRRR